MAYEPTIRIMKIKKSQTENPANTPPPHKPNIYQRIFVVENDADSRRLNSEILIHAGYHVDTAEDGSTAWDILQLNSYDLLITAQHMPKVSGVELLKKMHDTTMRLPTIMTTRTLPTWEFTLHPWLQSVTMLRKPYTFDNLLGNVKTVLHATTVVREEMAPPLNWQIQPLADRFRV